MWTIAFGVLIGLLLFRFFDKILILLGIIIGSLFLWWWLATNPDAGTSVLVVTIFSIVMIVAKVGSQNKSLNQPIKINLIPHWLHFPKWFNDYFDNPKDPISKFMVYSDHTKSKPFWPQKIKK